MEVLISSNENIVALMYALNSGLNFSEMLKNRGEILEKFRAEISRPEIGVKPSVFNYHVAAPEKILLYNTLYNALVKLSKDELAQLNGEKICSPDLREKFLEFGIFVAENVDERENYRKWRQETQQFSEHFSVNVTTTLKCNARCKYCYEHGVKQVDFDETKLDALINFIKQRKKTPPVKLNWFGGEPFLNPKIIDTVTGRLAELGLNFNCFAITNGILLTKPLIKKFKKWHLDGVQITLDGTGENYARRKAYLGTHRNAFKKILDRISWLAESDIHVDIRLNADRQNLDDLLDLIYILQARFDETKNVVYYPAFVTGLEDKLTDAEKISFVKEIFTALANPNKMSIANRLRSFPKNIPCMRNDPQSFSVDVYGRIYACEHLVGVKEKSLGTLKRLSPQINDARSLENLRDECKICVFLPKCMGGCASNLNTGDAACMIERYIIPAYMNYLCEQIGGTNGNDFANNFGTAAKNYPAATGNP